MFVNGKKLIHVCPYVEEGKCVCVYWINYEFDIEGW